MNKPHWLEKVRYNEMDCTVGVQLSLLSSGGYQRCEATVNGTIPCTRQQFDDGSAMQYLANKLFDALLPMMNALEEGWIPEGTAPVRSGFDEKLLKK